MKNGYLTGHAQNHRETHPNKPGFRLSKPLIPLAVFDEKPGGSTFEFLGTSVEKGILSADPATYSEIYSS